MSEYTETEEKAIADGWKPQDQLEEGKEFIPAEKFLENGTFFKKISEQKKRILKLEEGMSQLNEHHSKVNAQQRKQLEKDYQSQIESLKAQKVEALDDNDNKRVVEIDEELRNTEKPPAINEEFTTALNAFKSDNKWYNEDAEMQEDADIIGFGYNQKHPDIAPDKIFEHIVTKMKKLYPDKFENGKRNDPPSVEGGTAPAPKGKSATISDLSPDEKKVFDNFDRMHTFKDDKAKKQYFSDVVAMRG